jgi:hypothetical protein
MRQSRLRPAQGGKLYPKIVDARPAFRVCTTPGDVHREGGVKRADGVWFADGGTIQAPSVEAARGHWAAALDRADKALAWIGGEP